MASVTRSIVRNKVKGNHSSAYLNSVWRKIRWNKQYRTKKKLFIRPRKDIGKWLSNIKKKMQKISRRKNRRK